MKLAATLMLNNGIPAIVVCQILGHSKTSVSTDLYGHFIVEMQDDAAILMDEIVNAGMENCVKQNLD
jgi:intergrase/recombinase